MAKRGYKTTTINLSETKRVKLYTSQRVLNAVSHLEATLQVFEWSRVLNLCEAFFEHGKKEGARAAFEALELGMQNAKAKIPHRRPGKPKRR